MNKSPSPTSIVAGGSSTLTWSSSNASACTASGAWSGAKALSGSQTVSPTLVGLPAGQAGTRTYTLSCSGAGGSVTASASVTVTSSTCRTCSKQGPVTAPATAGAGLPAGQAGTTSASLRQYSYDAAGRVTADGVHGYSWNAADELVQITGKATYAYDANGKRIKTTLASGTLG